MDRVELMQSIDRLRRSMPRNPDVLVVCQGAELWLKANKPPFNRNEYHRRYMKEYMRKWRAAKKQAD